MAAALRFFKMHGLGNDYVFVEEREIAALDPAELSRRVSDRHTGVGSDGLIAVGPGDGRTTDLTMRIWNADGSEAQMCGNGLRCVGALAHRLGLARGDELRVRTEAGLRRIWLDVRGGAVEAVRTAMGRPHLARADVPMSPGAPDPAVEAPLAVGREEVRVTCLSVGNPHAVIFVDDVGLAPVGRLGSLVERHPAFPERVNVGFACVQGRQAIALRVYERGSGETRACGTGAAAALVAAVTAGKTDRRAVVTLPGGALEVAWPVGDEVYVTGPAVLVFEGALDPTWMAPASARRCS